MSSLPVRLFAISQSSAENPVEGLTRMPGDALSEVRWDSVTDFARHKDHLCLRRGREDQVG